MEKSKLEKVNSKYEWGEVDVESNEATLLTFFTITKTKYGLNDAYDVGSHVTHLVKIQRRRSIYTIQ